MLWKIVIALLYMCFFNLIRKFLPKGTNYSPWLLSQLRNYQKQYLEEKAYRKAWIESEGGILDEFDIGDIEVPDDANSLGPVYGYGIQHGLPGQIRARQEKRLENKIIMLTRGAELEKRKTFWYNVIVVIGCSIIVILSALGKLPFKH